MTQVRLAIEKNGHGGRRDGAGRPPLVRRAGLPHRSRPVHKCQHPVHVTWRFVRGLPSLRKLALARVLGLVIRRNTEGQLRRATSFRTIHFSIQPNHLHLIVEAGDTRTLTAALRGLGIWLARRLNAALARDGRVLADRYHSRELTSPREVRSAIVYVLQNHRHHAPSDLIVDENSSARWFAGWSTELPPPDTPSPVAPPVTWLARVGWMRSGGPIRFSEAPRS